MAEDLLECYGVELLTKTIMSNRRNIAQKMDLQTLLRRMPDDIISGVQRQSLLLKTWLGRRVETAEKLFYIGLGDSFRARTFMKILIQQEPWLEDYLREKAKNITLADTGIYITGHNKITHIINYINLQWTLIKHCSMYNYKHSVLYK